MTQTPSPSQTFTFLFTDLEGSTRLWEQHPQAMRPALARHDEILRSMVESSGGAVVKSTGDGLMAAFPSAEDGVSAALRAQQGLVQENWGEVGELRVRMGLHAGVAQPRGGDYYGPVVNRAARIMAVAHGSQVVLSAATAALMEDNMPDGVTLRDLGEHRLKDLERPEHLYQLVHPDLPADFPLLLSLSRRRHNLPTFTSVFVGRETELAEIGRQLADDGVRLLTLLGPGGTGKTRLSLQAAAEQIDRFPDGVFFVDLAEARNPEQVIVLIARTAELEETSEQPLVDSLIQQLATSSVLLILDNFEQAVEAGPTLVELLQRCPHLKAMVTSRESLRLRGEHVLEVPPLGLPDPHSASAESVSRNEAVMLFVDRAEAVRPDFGLTDDVAATVAAICTRLDGLPLAIELAAARLAVFSPEALLDRLSKGLKALGGGFRDLPPRQQTLWSTIDWSYQLLESSERLLFCLLSVFSGIGTEPAEGVVAELDWADLDGVDLIEGLVSLTAKSLIRREEVATAAPRFSMLRTIREYAAGRLGESPDLEAQAHRAHASYFTEFARSQRQSLRDRKRKEVVDDLATEADDLEAAWNYWMEAGDLQRLDEMLAPLWLLYDARGWHRSIVDMVTRLLEVLAARPSSPEVVRQQVTLMTTLARVMLAVRGYTEEVAETYNRALELAEQGEEIPELFPVLRGLSSLYNFRAEYAKGNETGIKLLEVAERHEDPSMTLEARLVLGTSACFMNDLENGLHHLDLAIDLIDPERDMARQLRFGPYPGIACLTTSAFLRWIQGFADRAREQTERALQIAADVDHPISLAYARYHVGFFHLWREEPEKALELAHAVLDVAEEFDLVLWKALGHCLRGAARSHLGEPDGLDEIEMGMGLYQGLTTPPVFWPLLLFLKARALGRAGRPEEAMNVLREAMTIDTTEEGYGLVMLPEFAILAGDLTDATGDEEGAVAWFEQALATANDMDLRTPRLRAATRLARLRRDSKAVADLEQAYAALSEGLSTVDALEAKRLLDELAG